MPQTLPTDPLSLLSAQVEAATVETQVLAERINELTQMHEEALVARAWADHDWRRADESLQLAKQRAAEAAAEAYRTSGGLPPALHDTILRDLQQLSPQQAAALEGESAAFDLRRATETEARARALLVEKTEAEKTVSTELATVTTLLTQRSAALLVLEQRLEKLMSAEELRKERETEQLGGDYTAGKSNKGLVAHPDARKAVLYALDQLGKPYQFAEEGPDRFDCSGLTQTSYRQSGRLLPRVSKDQFNAYRNQQVALDALLPGDLLFFARDKSDWRTIHHVMIYLGDNKIVHAPKAGDFVKISRINLGYGSPVDFAVRIIDAVQAPETPPTTPPTNPPTTPPTNPPTTPPTTPPPTTPPPTTPSPTPTPTEPPPSPTPTEPPASTPSPTPTPTEPPSEPPASPSAAPSSTPSPNPSVTATTSP